MVVVVLCCPKPGTKEKKPMYTPLNGDIGEEKKIIELEPLEVPVTAPAEEPVPA